MDALLLEKVTKQISEDATLRQFLERNRNLSGPQELLLGCYIDKKLTMAAVGELMPLISDDKILDRIVALIQTGQNAREAEAMVWLEDHGFGKVIEVEKLTDEEKEFVYCRVKYRVVQLINVEKELGRDESKVLDFLSLTKSDYELKIWHTPYGWCHSADFRDESVRIIVVSYRLFRQYNIEYLKAIMALPSFASKMHIGISFGAYLDKIVEMAEVKITPQTIFDLFSIIGDLSIPGKDALNYQPFGKRVDEVIQYWIKHPYKVFDGFGRPRDIKKMILITFCGASVTVKRPYSIP